MLVKKMHANGNDYCVIKYEHEIVDYNKLAKEICNRKTGVGADGLVVIKEDPLEMRLYKSDGSRVPSGANSIACLARFLYEEDKVKRNKLSVITGAGTLEVEIVDTEDFRVKVDMGEPIFNNSVVYASDPIDVFGRLIKVSEKKAKIFSFFLGDIQTVVFVESFDSEIVKLAKELCEHKLFAKKTNVNFVIVKDDRNIDVRTYERGVGFVLASGSGCCASVVAARKLGLTRTIVRCNLEVGYVDVEISRHKDVYVTCPAIVVFETNYNYLEEK